MHELVSCELTQVHDVLTAIKGHWRWCRLRLLLLVLASLYRSKHVLQISLPLLFCRRTLISYDTSIEKRNPIVYASRSSFACPVFVGISSGAIWFWYSRYVSSGFCGISSGGKKIAWHWDITCTHVFQSHAITHPPLISITYRGKLQSSPRFSENLST